MNVNKNIEHFNFFTFFTLFDFLKEKFKEYNLVLERDVDSKKLSILISKKISGIDNFIDSLQNSVILRIDDPMNEFDPKKHTPANFAAKKEFNLVFSFCDSQVFSFTINQNTLGKNDFISALKFILEQKFETEKGLSNDAWQNSLKSWVDLVIQRSKIKNFCVRSSNKVKLVSS
jgi:hypothetical protein